jgi:ABC-2 type transport system permease protein
VKSKRRFSLLIRSAPVGAEGVYMKMTNVANFSRYLRFIVRRERIVGSIWVAALILSAVGLAAAYPSLFPTHESLMSMSAALSTPAMVAMLGPVYGLTQMSVAIAMAGECLIWLAITSIVMNIFYVNRHTRVDEELGRHEMLAALPVGRMSGSAATLFGAFVLNLVIALATALLLLAVNLPGSTTAGSFCYAFSIGVQGFLFAAITLLMAQLFSTASGSMGAAFGVMGLFYLLRAAGDMSGNVLSYISPMGLGLKIEAYYKDDFLPILIILAEALVVSAAVLIISTKRDVGAGVIPARKGKSHASPFLQSPFGLAWRLVRKSFIIWAIACFVLGASYGSVVGEIDSFVEGNDTIKMMLAAAGGGSGSLIDAFLPMLSSIMAMIGAIPMMNCMNRLRTEERRGRLEQIYARRVSRTSMFFGFITIAAAEAVILTFLTSIGLYASSANSGMLTLGGIFSSAYVFLPAMLVMLGLAALLVGAFSRFVTLNWLVLGYSFMMLYFGRLFNVPKWAARLSPFGNVPQLPVEEFRLVPLLILCGIAIVLTLGGILRYRKRDIY